MRTKRKSKKEWKENKLNYKHNWKFEGRAMSNLINLGEGDVGFQKCLRRKLDKSEFTANFADDISGLFRLTAMQLEVLKVLLLGDEFRTTFKLNEETFALIAGRCGYTPVSVKSQISSLMSSKKLIVKVETGKYKLDKGLVYIMEEVRKMDFVQVLLTYEFVNKNQAVEKEAGEFPDITLDFINKVSEVYRLQQERKEKIKALKDDGVPEIS